jgi:hypothetical protein
MLAARNGHVEASQLLLESKADVNTADQVCSSSCCSACVTVHVRDEADQVCCSRSCASAFVAVHVWGDARRRDTGVSKQARGAGGRGSHPRGMPVRDTMLGCSG